MKVYRAIKLHNIKASITIKVDSTTCIMEDSETLEDLIKGKKRKKKIAEKAVLAILKEAYGINIKITEKPEAIVEILENPIAYCVDDK